MTQPVKIVAMLTALPGQREALAALLNGMIAPSRAEPGNLRYDLWQDPTNADMFLFDELYVDAAAIDAHRATPHFQDYVARIEGLAERSAWVVDPVNIS